MFAKQAWKSICGISKGLQLTATTPCILKAYLGCKKDWSSVHVTGGGRLVVLHSELDHVETLVKKNVYWQYATVLPVSHCNLKHHMVNYTALLFCLHYSDVSIKLHLHISCVCWWTSGAEASLPNQLQKRLWKHTWKWSWNASWRSNYPYAGDKSLESRLKLCMLLKFKLFMVFPTVLCKFSSVCMEVLNMFWTTNESWELENSKIDKLVKQRSVNPFRPNLASLSSSGLGVFCPCHFSYTCVFVKNQWSDCQPNMPPTPIHVPSMGLVHTNSDSLYIFHHK